MERVFAAGLKAGGSVAAPRCRKAALSAATFPPVESLYFSRYLPGDEEFPRSAAERNFFVAASGRRKCVNAEGAAQRRRRR